VAMVTGAARGIGLAVARRFLTEGWGVAMLDIDAPALALAAAELGESARVLTLACDVAYEDQVAAAVQRLDAHFGRLDALVNNASSFFATKVGAVDTAAWDDLIGSNLKAPLFLSQAAAPHLEASGGCIVNITDIHAERPLKGYPLYCAAKAGLLGLTRALALELGPRVRVNAVAPGPIEWPQGTHDFPPEARTAIIAHTLLKRVGSPADIAQAVKFLIFDAPYVTGQVINVDGGRTAHL
jgi:pteridine reductase